jgi:hypothetical protein
MGLARMGISGACVAGVPTQRGWVMKMNTLLKQQTIVRVGTSITRLSRFRTIYVLSSSAYCLMHWLISHNFSGYMFSGALVFGAMVATAVARFSKPTRDCEGEP